MNTGLPVRPYAIILYFFLVSCDRNKIIQAVSFLESDWVRTLAVPYARMHSYTIAVRLMHICTRDT